MTDDRPRVQVGLRPPLVVASIALFPPSAPGLVPGVFNFLTRVFSIEIPQGE